VKNTDLQLLYKTVNLFEQNLCNYTGSKYAVSVDCCTNALLLCFQYLNPKTIILPKNTFIGVASAATHLGIRVKFKDIKWNGMYKIEPLNVFDCARRFTSNMYIKNSFMCLSFHYKKHLKIGRGGAILLDNYEAYEWFLKARNCGKDISLPLFKQTFDVCGWNMLLHPELAKKGIKLLKKMPKNNLDLPYEFYGNLNKQITYQT